MGDKKMDKKSEGMIKVFKEIMKLPLDEETRTVKVDDIVELMETLSKEIPQKDRDEFLKQSEDKDK